MSRERPQPVVPRGDVILLVWALVENWEAMDSSPERTEKALEVVSSCLPSKAAWTAAGTVGGFS